MACRRCARRCQPGHTCSNVMMARSCEQARDSSAKSMRTRLPVPERATSREWTSAADKWEQRKGTTFTTMETDRQTVGCTRYRRHATEIVARTYKWLKVQAHSERCPRNLTQEHCETSPRESAQLVLAPTQGVSRRLDEHYQIDVKKEKQPGTGPGYP